MVIKTKVICDNHGESEMKLGFLAFVKLVVTLYFKKHLSAFTALILVETPIQFFHSFPGQTMEDRHQHWYGDIHGIVSEQICIEEERASSYTALILWRHWLI